MRPSDLAREHGLSTQAVRNYERDGFLPPADRSPTGYRLYTETHAAALRAYLALVTAHGYPAAGEIMTAIHTHRLDDALLIIDRSHEQLLRDRQTLNAVRDALAGLPTATHQATHTAWSIGDLARRLGITPATLRKWETAGILTPTRDPATSHRTFQASDIRDAELAHMLRRGGYPLTQIAAVVQQIRTAGGADALTRTLADWQQRLTTQALAMLTAATTLNAYLATLR